jgi:protein required for attachment to host cells
VTLAIAHHHPQEKLAKFGYNNLERKVDQKKIKNLVIILVEPIV